MMDEYKCFFCGVRVDRTYPKSICEHHFGAFVVTTVAFRDPLLRIPKWYGVLASLMQQTHGSSLLTYPRIIGEPNDPRPQFASFDEFLDTIYFNAEGDSVERWLANGHRVWYFEDASPGEFEVPSRQCAFTFLEGFGSTEVEYFDTRLGRLKVKRRRLARLSATLVKIRLLLESTSPLDNLKGKFSEGLPSFFLAPG